MGFWTNRAIYALLKTRPAKENQQLPLGMLAPVAVPTFFSILSYKRRVAWLSNVKGADPESHLSEVLEFRSVGFMSNVYPVLVTLIYAMPIFLGVAGLIADPSSMSARYAIGAIALNIPGTLLLLLCLHITFRWCVLGIHAFFLVRSMNR